MNLKNRALRLIAVVSIISGLFTSPASANDITYDSTGIKVPAGITFVVDGMKFENDYTYLLVTINSSLDTTSKFLTFKDFAISGVLDGDRPFNQKIQYFDGDNLNQQVTVNLLIGDVTAQKLNLIISGNGTLENKSDIAYPGSFTSVIASLDAMGLEATGGNHYWGTEARYGYYVMAKLKTGVKPFQIKVRSATLSGNEISPVPLGNFERPTLMGTEPVEIALGSSAVDPYINLTGVALDAVFGVYTPSTVTTSVTFPAGIEAIAQQNIYFDQVNNKSFVNLLLKNTSKNTISLNTGGIYLVDSKSDATKKLAAVDKDYTLNSIAPTVTVNEEELFPLSLVAAGNLTEEKSLDFKGKAVIATPSKVDISKVKLPSGLSFLPVDFGSLGYNSKTKRTTLYVALKNNKTDPKVAALSFANVKAVGAKIDPANPYAGPFVNADKKRNEYFYEIGSFAGDVRVGKKLSLTGKIVALARTKYTNTATLATNNEGIIVDSYAMPPEYWKYNSKTKTTAITKYFYSTIQSKEATIYSCNLKISLNGKTIKSITTGTKYDPASDSGEVLIATLPGDLRVKGGSVEITGSYSLQPCS